MSCHKTRNWLSVDWTKTTQQLVSEMQVSKTSVIYWRKKLDPATLGKRLPERLWAVVGWEKATSKIARALGVTKSAVAQQRKKLAPKTIRIKMTFAEQLQAARISARLSQSQAALAIGRSASTLRKWEQGVNTPHSQIQALALSALKAAKRKSRKAEKINLISSCIT